MTDRTKIADALQHDAEQAAGVIEQAMRNEGLIDKDVRLMGEIITEALDAAGFDVVLRADPDTSDERKPCPHCNDEGMVCTLDGDIIGPCDCTSDDLFTEARRLLDAATPGPWERPSSTANWFTVPQPIQIDEADWGQEAQENGAMCGYRIGTLADERAWRYADAELIAAAPRLIAALLERAVTAEAATTLTGAADYIRKLTTERDAERAAREQAEAENGRLRALTEGDPYSIYYEAAEMRSELMHLRRWKLEATEVIESWELVYEALGDVGGLGQRRSDAVLAEVLRMKAELDRAQLRSIEASNPGIDMDEVRAFRAGAANLTAFVDRWPDHDRMTDR